MIINYLHLFILNLKSLSVGDSESKASELEKYWQVVKDNPSDFAGWTYLLHYIEQEVR